MFDGLFIWQRVSSDLTEFFQHRYIWFGLVWFGFMAYQPL